MNTEQILLSILREEIGGNEISEHVKSELSSEICSKLYILSEKHDIAHIVAAAFSRMGLLGKDEISLKFNRRLMSAVYRREQMNCVLKQVCDILEKSEIPHIPLKGSVLCQYYPQTWMRTSCDVDILIHKNDSEKAIKSLCELGYELQKTTSVHDYSLFSPGGVHLELHFSLMQEEHLATANTVLESVWDYAVPEVESAYRMNLTNEMFVLYHMAHMAKHFIHGGCGIRPFMDLWIMKSKMPVETDRLHRILQDAQLLDFYKSACDLAAVWFGNCPHSMITKQMESFILTGGVYGTINNSAVMKAATGETKARSFMKLLILSREGLEILYPKLEKYPMLMPYYQVKRWFGVFRKKRRDRIKHITSVRNSVSREDAESAANLLESLGLDR